MLSELLRISPGITAIVGSGGKTSTLYRLAEELVDRGQVICTTTTHIFPPAHMPLALNREELVSALARYPCVCTGSPAEGGKLTAPALSMDELSALARYVLVEADGARGLPLKAHLPHEPVIPAQAGRTILVVGLTGLGQPVRTAAHRYERFCALSGLTPEDAVTPRTLARVLLREGLGDMVFLNQAEEAAALRDAAAIAKELSLPVLAGSLRKGEFQCLW